MHPSSRRPPNSRYGEERPSSFPARPRLNRETVDRAWESGAQQSHADYRPRSGGQPPRNARYNNHQQPSEHESFQNGRNNTRPYNNRQGQYRDSNYRDQSRDDYRDRNAPRRFERSFEGEQGPRSRSYQSGRRDFQDQGERRSFERRNYADGQQGGRGPYQGRNFSNDGQSNGRYARSNNYNQNGPRRDFRSDQRPRDFERNDQRRDHTDPRWQARPNGRRDDAPYEPRGYARHQGQQFEGDYEHFANTDERHSGPRRFDSPNQNPAGRPFQGRQNRQDFQEPRARGYHQERRERPSNQEYRGNRPFREQRKEYEQDEPEERHITRLPDGRVLKGSRPSQRKQARFWQEVSEDTDTLLNEVHLPEVEAPQGESDTAQPLAEGEEGSSEEASTAAPKKRRARPASAIARSKKGAPTGRTSSGPKPSQRGFKWPTQ